jgi:hypothetical protein
MRTGYEVAGVLDLLGDGVNELGLNTWQLRTLSAIKICRTAALGGHIDACEACGNIRISYNSCRNRHCPKCQGHKREEWIQARGTELLPVPYFHVVFTLPQELNSLAMGKSRDVYDALFTAAWKTLEAFGRNKGLQTGMISVLHTWGQNLSLHPHLHCIVPGGGVDKNGNWQNIRADGKFLFPVKAFSKVFRAKYVAALAECLELDKKFRESLFKKDWVVYAVIEYLGRYTHKIAISNNRLKEVNENSVTFTYKDYKTKGEKKLIRLSHEEFIRRFSLHILPRRFVKMRHYGFLSSSWKRQKLKALQEKLHVKINDRKPKTLLRKCPCCKEGNLITIEVFGKRGPPEFYMGDRQTINPHKD